MISKHNYRLDKTGTSVSAPIFKPPALGGEAVCRHGFVYKCPQRALIALASGIGKKNLSKIRQDRGVTRLEKIYKLVYSPLDRV